MTWNLAAARLGDVLEFASRGGVKFPGAARGGIEAKGGAEGGRRARERRVDMGTIEFLGLRD